MRGARSRFAMPLGKGRLTLLAVAISAASYASAQEAQPGKKPEEEASTQLQKVVVTAQKREEKAQDIPMALSVTTADDLAKNDATQFRDIANSVPSLSYTTNGAGSNQINIRGVTSGTNVSPTVGLYVDDVPYGSSTAFAGAANLGLDAGLFDLDRIEVLRGPQGTYYGSSSMGGLLKYVTRKPDTSYFGGEVQSGLSATEGGNLNYYGNAAINLPLVSDVLAARVSTFYSRDAGYIDNIAPNGDNHVNRSKIDGGRADVLFTPNDAFSLRLTAFAQDIDRHGSGTVDKDLNSGHALYGSLKQNRLTDETFDQEFRLYSGTASYDFGPVTLTSISSYQTVKTDSVTDFSALYVPLLGADTFGSAAVPNHWETDKYTQELRLSSSGVQRVDWNLGAFYTHEKSQNDQQLQTYLRDGSPSGVDLLTASLPSKYEEYAGYGNLTFHATDKLDLGLGLRYSESKQTIEQIASGQLAGSAPKADSKDEVATYLGNIAYHFTDQLMVYGRVSTGYRPGGANVQLASQSGHDATFDSDKLINYELGTKLNSADGRWSLESALYQIDWKDMQVAAVIDGISGIANAGKARIRGLENTLAFRPSEAWSMNGSLVYTQAELSEDSVEVGGNSGDRIPNVPRLTASYGTDYQFHLLGQPARVGGTVRYVGKRNASFDATPGLPQYRLDSYVTTDLRAGMDFGSVRTQLYVRNLFNKRGDLSADTSLASAGGPARVAILQPRTIGVSANLMF